MRGQYLGLTQALLIIAPLTIAVRASNNMLMTTIPLLARYNFHFSNTLIGLLSALTALMTFLSSGLVNSRLRAHSRRLIFIVSSIIYAVVYPLFWLSTPLIIWPLSAIAGFTLGFLMPNIITSASLLPDRRTRERLLNIYTLSLSISLILGPAIESFILKYYSLRESFLLLTALPVLALVITPLVKFPEETSDYSPITYSNVLSNPGFITAVLNIATYNVVFSFLMAFGGIYARDSFGVSYSMVEILFSLFFVASFLSRLYLSIKPAERLWPFMGNAVLLTVIGVVMIGFTNNYLVYTAALLVLGIPHGITYPLSVVAISRAFKPQHRNTANSLFFSFMMLIGIFTPMVTGYIADLIGIRNTFIVLILPVITALVFLRKYVKTVDKPPG